MRLLDEPWLSRTREKASLLESHHSTHMAGARLTLDQSAEIWAGRGADCDRDDVRELQNHGKAISFLGEHIEPGHPITEDLIRDIHRRLVQDVRDNAAAPGEWRKVPSTVVNGKAHETVHQPPLPEEIPALMRDFVAWLNTADADPIVMAGIAQFQLVHIHPFIDGNGRTSRLLSLLILYRNGLDFQRIFNISEFYDRDRDLFYSSIGNAEKSGMDLTSWLEYFTSGLKIQVEGAVKEAKAFALAHGQASFHGLNGRQSEILSIFLKNNERTAPDLARSLPDIGLRTIQRDLKALEQKGLIEKAGLAGNKNKWRLLEDKSERP